MKFISQLFRESRCIRKKAVNLELNRNYNKKVWNYTGSFPTDDSSCRARNTIIYAHYTNAYSSWESNLSPTNHEDRIQCNPSGYCNCEKKANKPGTCI